jgi:hypothetical protein
VPEDSTDGCGAHGDDPQSSCGDDIAGGGAEKTGLSRQICDRLYERERKEGEYEEGESILICSILIHIYSDFSPANQYNNLSQP